jgi:hypothetical protein
MPPTSSRLHKNKRKVDIVFQLMGTFMQITDDVSVNGFDVKGLLSHTKTTS